jgi:hypothetical protein
MTTAMMNPIDDILDLLLITKIVHQVPSGRKDVNVSLPFCVSWINSLDGVDFECRDVQRRAWGRALLPAPIQIA